MPWEDFVLSTMEYAVPMDVEPEIFFYEPEPERRKNDPVYNTHEVRICNLRGHENETSFDEHGFSLISIDAVVAPFADRNTVEKKYYPEAAELVKSAVGAVEVHAFDHNYRSDIVEQQNSANALPVRLVHNDYTEISAPTRVRELLPDRAEELLRKRYAFINLWRPLSHTVQDWPLGVCAANSVQGSDFFTLALRYSDRNGQIYLVRHNPNHEWYFVSQMRTNEALLLKVFDSAEDGRSRYTPHSAFKDPSSPDDAKPRISIETRTVAFFD